MQPFIVGLIIGCAHGRHHRPLAVGADEIIERSQPDSAIFNGARRQSRATFPSGCTAVSSGGASRVVAIALIALHLIGGAELFEQPQNPLRAGIVEMMQG